MSDTERLGYAEGLLEAFMIFSEPEHANDLPYFRKLVRGALDRWDSERQAQLRKFGGVGKCMNQSTANGS